MHKTLERSGIRELAWHTHVLMLQGARGLCCYSACSTLFGNHTRQVTDTALCSETHAVYVRLSGCFVNFRVSLFLKVDRGCSTTCNSQVIDCRASEHVPGQRPVYVAITLVKVQLDGA